MSKLAARWEVGIFLGVFLIGFGFAVFTHHAWEDFFIVLRQAQNLANGHGLVYTVGERVQTFTSPLGILIPAVTCRITGATTYEPVLWVFRVISLAALASTAVLFYQILRRFQRHIFATVFTLLLVTFDAKTVDFSVSGMETGLFVFFLALTVHGLLLAGPRQRWRIGLGFAGLMWTRPDGCIFIAGLGLGALLFLPGKGSGDSRDQWFKRLLLACGICTVLYLPWFLWAWWYYGSPVPHSVVAKGLNFPAFSLGKFILHALLFPIRQLGPDSTIAGAYLPAYSGDDWGTLFVGVSLAFSWIASLVWVCPVVRPQARMLSFATYVGHLYIADVVNWIYPWYWPPVALLGYLTNGLVLDQLLSLSQPQPDLKVDRRWLRHLPRAASLVATLLLVGQLGIFISSAREMQVLQQLVEDRVRQPVGEWLRAHARSSNDTVMLEPLGYVGYFSGLRMYDFVGLASKEMVETRRRLGPDRERTIWRELKPDWLVLTPRELAGEMSIDPAQMRDFYETAAIFDQSKQVEAIKWLPGRRMVAFYQTYFILKRKDVPALAPAK